MNFALMFALALGIDYALFIVMRFRNAHFGSGMDPVDAVATTMDTAGKAVLFSGLTVLISLSAVMLVPSPAFRSMSLGIMISVIFVLAATLTLLPAVLAKLGPRVDRLSLPVGPQREHRSPRFARWGERLSPAAVRRIRADRAAGPCAAGAQPADRDASIKVVPEGDPSRVGYTQITDAFGPGAPGALQVVAPAAELDEVASTLRHDPGIAAVMPVQQAGSTGLIEAIPVAGPSTPTLGTTVDRLRGTLRTRR